jgi:hypothetical protein
MTPPPRFACRFAGSNHLLRKIVNNTSLNRDILRQHAIVVSGIVYNRAADRQAGRLR